MKQVGVIGAGVIGLCTALEAQSHGYDVTIIDKNAPGQGSSFGNAGYLATELIDPLSTLRTLRSSLQLWMNPNGPVSVIWRYLPRSLPWYFQFIKQAKSEKVARNRVALSSLNRAAVAAWQRRLKDIDADALLVRSGYLLVWENPSHLREAIRLQQHYISWGIESKLLDRQAVAKLEPELAGQVNHALLFPEGHRVTDPSEVCNRLFRTFEQRGGQFIRQEVTSICRQGQGIDLRLKQTENLRYDSIIVCTGAWSRPLLKTMGLAVPVVAERGYHLTLTQSAPVTHVIGSADRKVVLTPLSSGLRIVGISEVSGPRQPEKRRNYRILKHHLRKLLPCLSAGVHAAEPWVGCRPTLPDSLPVIDSHPEDPRILFAFGNQHLGLTQGAVTAELVVSQLTGKPCSVDIDITSFRIDRF